MSASISLHGITSMRVLSEPIPRSNGGEPFYVTRVYFCNKDGIESSVTAMHGDKPVTLDGAEFMTFVTAVEAVEA